MIRLNNNIRPIAFKETSCGFQKTFLLRWILSFFCRFNALIDIYQNIESNDFFFFFKVQAYSGCAGDETG